MATYLNLKSNKIFITFCIIIMQIMFIQNIKVYFCLWFFVLLNEKIFNSLYSKILFLFHYFFTYIYIVFDYFSKTNIPIFWDMQSFLQLVNCNYDSSYEFAFLNSSTTVRCIEDIGFGPLSFFLSAKLNTILFTNIIAIFYFICLCLILYKNFQTTEFIKVTLLLMSPSFLFLFESLNPDIFIFIYFIYRFLLKKENIRIGILDFLLLTVFTQLKIYTLAILLGIFVYKYLNKEKINVASFFVLLNISLLTYHYFVLNKDTPIPVAINRTFGIFSDYYIFKNSFGINFYVLFLFLCTFLIFIIRKELYQFTNLDNSEYFNFVAFIYIPMIILILIFGNYGYKFIFVILFFIALPLNPSLISKIIINFSFLSTPLLYLFGYEYSSSIFNFLFYVFNRISLLFILIVIVSMFMNILKTDFTIEHEDVE